MHNVRFSLALLIGFFYWGDSFEPALGAESSPDNNSRPNVLFIAIDDLRTELGCYGHDYVDSPHLDRLASEGVLFNNHFVQVATCGASRYAMLTGQSPWRTKAFGNRDLYEGTNRLNPVQQPGAQTMPELFRRSGYHTVLIGKISHTADGKVFAYDGTGDGRPELPHAWDEFATPLGPWKRGWGIFFAYRDGRHREDGNGHIDLMEFTAEKDDDLPDGMMATRAIEKLGELKERKQPFFMGLGFFKPHLPFVAPRQDWEAMAERDVPPPENPEIIESSYQHKSNEFYKYNAPWDKTYPLAREDAITARRAYLACVRYTDRQVGRVLSALDELGLRDNTIVVVWGDHGWHLGESALWGKHTPFERANKSTLIMRAPGQMKAGTTSEALVETIDIYPTLIDLCQPEFRQTATPLNGHSLKPILLGEKVNRDHSISYWKSAVSLRTDKYRLITQMTKTGPQATELYDISQSSDPVENLAEVHPDIAQNLLHQLRQHLDTIE
ncbi:MAG: sulfatase [Planctomycetaceae bacterium]|nr:sulfatase [Planctomycetaceae bacterium]